MDSREKQRQAMIERWRDPEFRRKQARATSEAMLKLWKEKREQQLQAISNGVVAKRVVTETRTETISIEAESLLLSIFKLLEARPDLRQKLKAIVGRNG